MGLDEQRHGRMELLLRAKRAKTIAFALLVAQKMDAIDGDDTSVLPKVAVSNFIRPGK